MALRIAHFLSLVNEQFGGPVRAVIDLCNAMSDRGHDLSVLTWDSTSVPPGWGYPARPRVALVEEPAMPGRLFSGNQLRTIERMLDNLRPDCMHFHGVWDPNLAQLGRLAHSRNLPYYISVRGMLDDWSMAQRGMKKRLYLDLFGRSWLEHAVRVHLTAQAEMDQASKWFPAGRPLVIPNLLDLRPYKDPPGPAMAREKFPCLAAPEPTLLFLSRISYKKGVEHLLRAARLLHDRALPCHVIVAGDAHDYAYMGAIKDLVRKLGLEEWVKFPGHVGGPLKISLYQAADLLVLPTSQENFGFVFFEAMAAGLPVITTKGVDLWPELEHSGGASICEAEPDALAARIESLLADRPALNAMGERGREWTFRFLDTGRILDQFEEMYACR